MPSSWHAGYLFWPVILCFLFRGGWTKWEEEESPVVSWYCFGGHWQFICIKTKPSSRYRGVVLPIVVPVPVAKVPCACTPTPHGILGALQGLQKMQGIYMPKHVWLVVCCPSQQLSVIDQANYQLSPHWTPPTSQVGVGFSPLDGSEWWPMEYRVVESYWKITLVVESPLLLSHFGGYNL
jgi:hypothetical protein